MIRIPETIEKARNFQLELLGKLKFGHEFEFSHLKTIAGIDVSYTKEREILVAGLVLIDYPEMRVREARSDRFPIRFPYIPGYLSFREGPAILELLERMTEKPDLLMIDGHGIAHPRKMGIATFVGILSGIPSIGIAKKRLCGEYDMPDRLQGSSSPLYFQGEQVGYVYRSKTGVKPIYVSSGYLISQDKALELVKTTISKYRLPEPIRWAHQLVTGKRGEYQNRAIR